MNKQRGENLIFIDISSLYKCVQFYYLNTTEELFSSKKLKDWFSLIKYDDQICFLPVCQEFPIEVTLKANE